MDGMNMIMAERSLSPDVKYTQYTQLNVCVGLRINTLVKDELLVICLPGYLGSYGVGLLQTTILPRVRIVLHLAFSKLFEMLGAIEQNSQIDKVCFEI